MNIGKDDMVILGIESSCDETAAAIVEDGRLVRSNIVATQHELHREFAGIVPEIASRAHLERILPVIRTALSEADVCFDDLAAVAVGHRPGLIGSLLVGIAAAKALAWSIGKPLIGVDHIEAHLHAVTLDDAPIVCPAIGLVVSGGHTSLFVIESNEPTRMIGRTIDDAIGEAFDKAATILQLGYPGGPEIDRLARDGDDRRYDLPVPALRTESPDFSFSGLKTALLYAVRGQPRKENGKVVFARSADDLSAQEKADFAASFQRAAIAAIVLRLERALDQSPGAGVVSLVVGGGVSANTCLRADLAAFAKSRGLVLRLSPPEYCVDNAAMIAGQAHQQFQRGDFASLGLGASTQSSCGVY